MKWNPIEHRIYTEVYKERISLPSNSFSSKGKKNKMNEWNVDRPTYSFDDVWSVWSFRTSFDLDFDLVDMTQQEKKKKSSEEM